MRKYLLILTTLVLVTAIIVSGCSSGTTTTTAPTTSAAPTTAAAPKTTTAPTTAPPVTSAAPSTSAVSKTSPSTQPSIKVGVMLDFTGPGSVNLNGMQAAVKLKVDQIGGQINGRPIELIWQDSATDPTVATEKAKLLVQQYNVDVVLGPLSGTDAVAGYLSQSGTPNITYLGNPRSILTAVKGGNVWLQSSNEGQGYYTAQYALNKGYKTGIIINDDGAGGNELLDGSVTGFQAGGGQIVQRIRTPIGSNDYSANILSFKKADVIMCWFLPPDGQRFLQQYYASGLKIPIVYCAAYGINNALLASIGDPVVGLEGQSFWTDMMDTPVNNAYVAAFKAATGNAPSAEATAAYVSMSDFIEAVKITGGDTSHTAINKAMLQVKFESPWGPWSFAQQPSGGIGVGYQVYTKVVKTSGGYGWQVIGKVSDTPSPLDLPASAIPK